MLQWINRLLRARRLSASIASRSATPVPKLSMATSADFASSCTSDRPFSDFILMAILRLLRLALRNTVPSPGAGNGGQPRVSSPCPTASTLIPTRGFATTYLLRALRLAQSRSKHTAEIGGKTFLRHQKIVGRTAFRFAE